MVSLKHKEADVAKRPTEREAVKRVGRKPIRGMTEGADLVWRAITRLWDEMDIPPSLKEVAEACHFSRTGISGHIGRLEALGIIERYPNTARGLRLLRRHPAVPVPEHRAEFWRPLNQPVAADDQEKDFDPL